MSEGDDKPKQLGGLLMQMLPPAVSKMITRTPSSNVVRTSAVATNNSVAVSGDNSGSIINLNVESLVVQQQIARELPSYLSNVVTKFSADWADYNAGPTRSLPPEVDVKLAYNDFPPKHPIIADYARYLHVLEASYRGVEQRNDDARRMVRRCAAVAYADQLSQLCKANGVKQAQAHDFARNHAVPLVKAVINALMADLAARSTLSVMHETAHLAVSLIVADAVIECEVLERPADAATS